jgi:hypothetical protein
MSDKNKTEPRKYNSWTFRGKRPLLAILAWVADLEAQARADSGLAQPGDESLVIEVGVCDGDLIRRLLREALAGPPRPPKNERRPATNWAAAQNETPKVCTKIIGEFPAKITHFFRAAGARQRNQRLTGKIFAEYFPRGCPS